MNSLSKNQLKGLAAYKQQKRCDEDGVFVVEGVKMCDEALASGFAIRTVCATAEYIETKDLSSVGDVYDVSGEQLERISNMRTPNKVWMLVERRTENARRDRMGATDVIEFKIQDSKLILALDGLQDPGNMGTIMRTADWYGIRHIVCSRDTVNCYNPKVVQASMGAIFRTTVEYTDLADWLEKVDSDGIATYGAMLDGEPYHSVALQRPAVLVVGNEGRGLRSEVAGRLRYRLTIPNIGGSCESLNAAVATAILCSEFYR